MAGHSPGPGHERSPTDLTSARGARTRATRSAPVTTWTWTRWTVAELRGGRTTKSGLTLRQSGRGLLSELQDRLLFQRITVWWPWATSSTSTSSSSLRWPVPDLTSGVAGIVQGGPDRRLGPGKSAAMAVAGSIGRRRAEHAIASQPVADGRQPASVEVVGEDSRHDRGSHRI